MISGAFAWTGVGVLFVIGSLGLLAPFVPGVALIIFSLWWAKNLLKANRVN